MARAVEPLDGRHRAEDFDCGKPELDQFLIHHALRNQAAEGGRTYVVQEGGRVIGYHTLVAGSVEHAKAPRPVRKGLGRYPVPVILLARLAVDRQAQGRGLGAALLKDALIRSARAANEIGARAVLVHALDEDAKAFYEHFDFEPSPTDPLHLYLLIQELRTWLAQVGLLPG